MVQESWSAFLLRTPKTCKTSLLKKYCILNYNGNLKMMKIGKGRQKIQFFQNIIFNLNSRDIGLGHRVGFYKIKGNIGKGNFSTVKIAIHALTQG